MGGGGLPIVKVYIEGSGKTLTVTVLGQFDKIFASFDHPIF